MRKINLNQKKSFVQHFGKKKKAFRIKDVKK